MDDFGIINYIEGDEIDEDNTQPNFGETYHSIEDIHKNYEILKKSNISRPVLTRYEKTKIIGLRAEMIARGAQPRVEVPNHVTSTIKIAEMEFNNKKTPFLIRRETSRGFEYWKLDDLVVR
jgi:DNA-directed RNA polymerase subunit K/omega